MIHDAVRFSAALVANRLTDEELAVLHLLATSGWKANGSEVGYEKWATLLTEEGKTKVHRDTAEALEEIVRRRFSDVKDEP